MLKLLLSLATFALVWTILVAVNRPARQYDIGGCIICCNDSTCVELPPGAILLIPQAAPSGAWDAFSAKTRL